MEFVLRQRYVNVFMDMKDLIATSPLVYPLAIMELQLSLTLVNVMKVGKEGFVIGQFAIQTAVNRVIACNQMYVTVASVGKVQIGLPLVILRILFYMTPTV
jgi:hypothetical protein